MRWYVKIGIALIIVAFLWYLLRLENVTESFATQRQNMNYQAKEVYLVGSIINTNTKDYLYDPIADTYRNGGFTYEAALARCQHYGGTLATKAQLQMAVNELNGNWCVAGWVSDDRTNAYFIDPFSGNNKICPNTTGTIPGIQRYIPSTTTNSRNENLAFATCYGPKPAMTTLSGTKSNVATEIIESATSSFDVQPFNKTSYSMISNATLMCVTSGNCTNAIAELSTIASQAQLRKTRIQASPTGQDTATSTAAATAASTAETNLTNAKSAFIDVFRNGREVAVDIFPKIFTTSQAYYALDNSTPKYNPTAARAKLLNDINNSETTNTDPLNTGIATVVNPSAVEDSTTITAWNDNAKNKTCASFTDIQNAMYGKLAQIHQLFSDLSGATQTTIKMKTENGYLQSIVSEICQGQDTDACRRLLALDYDIYYKDRTPNAVTQSYIIDDLENINLALSIQECNIQQSLGSVEYLGEKLLGCAPVPVPNNLKDKLKFRTNLQVNTEGGGVIVEGKIPLECPKSGQPTIATLANFKAGRDIPFNSVDVIKQMFQQISPYYSGSAYQDLVNTVLNRLTQILEIPDGSKFLQYDGIFNNSRKNLENAKNLLSQ